MHLLITSPYFFPALHYGGPTTATLDLARSLVNAGIKVTVFTTDSLTPYARVKEAHIQKDGVDIFYFKNRSNTFSSRFLYFNPIGFRQTLQQRIHEFDVIHINEFRVNMSYHAAKLAHQFSKPTILQPHGALPIAIQRQTLKRIFDLLMGKWTLRHVSKIACLNQVEEDDARHFGALTSQIFTLPNGITLPDPNQNQSAFNFRMALNIPENAKVILFLGRLHQKKGIDLLVEALGKMHNSSAHLILAGSDYDYQQKIAELVSQKNLGDRVHFTGFVDGERKAALLNTCDVMVLASRLEGLPVSVLEAMAHSKPVIISRACNLPEVAHAKAGIEIANENVEELVRALNDFFAMPEDSQREMGNNGIRLVKKQFSWDHITKHYINEMQALITAASNRH